MDAVRRVGLLARDTSPVRLEFNALGVKLSSSSPDLGQAVEAVEARYEGEDMTAAFNPHYLADGLAAATGDTVRLEVRDGLKPGVVRGESARVHVPRDAGPAADAGRIARRGSGRVRLLWVEAPRLPEPPRDAHLDVPEDSSTVVGSERRRQDEPPRGDGLPVLPRIARESSATLPLVREGADGRRTPRRGRDRERAGPRRGRDPAARARTGCRSTARRCGASATCSGQVRAVFFGPDDLDVVRGRSRRAAAVHGRSAHGPCGHSRSPRSPRTTGRCASATAC